MKRKNWKQRFLTIGMAVAMLINGIPLYAAEQFDYSEEYGIAEEMEGNVVEGNIPIVDHHAVDESNIPIVDDYAVPERDIPSDEVITEDDELVAEEMKEDECLESSSVTEASVEELNAQYGLKIRIDEVTRGMVKGVVSLDERPEWEDAYIIIEVSSDESGENYQSRRQIDEMETTDDFSVGDLYADTEYKVTAKLFKDYNTILETTETQSFRTEKNPIDFEVIPTVSDVTQNSAVVTVNLSENTIAWLNQEGIFSLYATVRYGISGDYTSEKYVDLKRSNDYSGTVTLEKLCAGAEYNLDVILKFYGLYGNTYTHHEFTTLDPDIIYTFDVEGNTIGTGLVSFSMEGYEEGKEYILEVYVSKNGKTKTYFERAYLNSENGYAFRSKRNIFDEIGCVYNITAEIKDASYQRLFLVKGKTVEIPLSKIFKVTVLEDSITYTTAKVKVEWIETAAISQENIEVSISQTGINTTTTLNKNNKLQVTMLLTNLKVGKEQELNLYAKLNGNSIRMESFQITTKANEFEKFTRVEFPTQLEIARKWKSLNISLTQSDTYEKNVNQKDGGVLSSKTLQNALNLTNFIRYVAGLPDDLVYDKEWCSICNAGSEINRLNGELNHYPAKPSSVTKAFYERGYLGTSSSNLAVGSKNLADSILLYMIDPGESNYAKGHRTWILQPYLGVVGFGKSQNFYSMYVLEGSSGWCNREVEFSHGYYYWPAHNMPVEIYGDDYWDNYGPSLYLSAEYDFMEPEDITLQVKSKKLGKTWTLKGNQGTYGSHKYMRVYGSYLVFDTGLYPKGDEVTVTVKGTTINGVDAPIVYTMNFFSLEDIDVSAIPVESVTVSSDTLELCEGDSTKIKAKILPTDANNKQVTWKVESEDGKGKASITQDGVLTAMLKGKVRVTATSKENKKISDSLTLSIEEKHIPLEEISFAKDSIRLEKGSVYCLPAVLTPVDTTENQVIYSSSDETKVSVKEGMITALEVTGEPVIIRATVGELYADCQVEVYEITPEEPDKFYSTRITEIRVKGKDTLPVGENSILKIYPVTNGYELTKEEYEIGIVCKGKKITLEPIESEDEGSWYRVTGNGKGKEKVTVTITTKFAESTKTEKASRVITFQGLEQENGNEEDMSLAPVLVNKNLSVNQNTAQGTKLDLRFRADNAQAERIYLTSKKQDGSEELFVISEIQGAYYLQTKEIIKNKKYQFVLHVETVAGEWEYPMNVTTKRSFPKVTIKQTGKPNINLLYENAEFSITGNELIKSIDFVTDSADFVKNKISGAGKEYNITLNQQEHGKKINKQGMVSVLFEGYRVPLEKKVTIVTTNKKVKADTLVADIGKVTLNSAVATKLSGTIQVGLKNSDFLYPDKIFVKGNDKNSVNLLLNKAISFTYNKNTGRLKVTTCEGAAKGNYKFTYTGMVNKNGEYVSTEGKGTLTVAISKSIPTVSLKASGTIDLIQRSQSFVTYTSTIKNVNGKVAAVELTKEDAGYFYARVTEEGKIRLYARAYAKLVPKQNYEIGMKITLDNGYEFEEKGVIVKPKQSAFKGTAKETKITLCKKETVAYPLEFVVKSPKNAAISYVKPVILPEGFVYDSSTRTIRIGDENKLKTNKTYSVSFEVTPTGAYRSIKPAKVTVKVKVR